MVSKKMSSSIIPKIYNKQWTYLKLDKLGLIKQIKV